MVTTQRSPIRKLWAGALALLILLLTVRVGWVAFGSDTGWETVAVSWHEATLGRIGLPRNDFQIDSPEGHVQFWRERLIPVLERTPEDADAALAAAYVAAEPVWGLFSGLVDLPGFTPSQRTRYSQSGLWTELSEQYYVAAAPTLLEFTTNATRRADGEQDRWRQRTMLQVHAFGREPSSGQWRGLLEDAKRHDPGNALYDYFAALRLWNRSCRFELDGQRCWNVVENADGFDEGWRCFEQGLQKERLEIPHIPVEDILALLSESDLTQLEASRIALWRSWGGRTHLLLHGLMRSLQEQAESKRRAGDLPGALELLELTENVIQQFESKVRPDHTIVVASHRAATLDQLLDLMSDDLDLLPGEKWEAYVAKRRDSRIQLGVAIEAQQRTRLNVGTASIFDAAFPVLLMEYAQTLFTAMLICSLMIAWAARLGRSEVLAPVRFGAWRHALTWVGCFGVSLLVFGVLPTEILAPEARRLAIATTAWILGGGWMIWLAAQLVRQCRRLRDSMNPYTVIATVATSGACAATSAIVLGLTMPTITWDRSDITLWLAGFSEVVLVLAVITPVLVLGLLLDWLRKRYRLKKSLPREYRVAASTLVAAILAGAISAHFISDWQLAELPALTPPCLDYRWSGEPVETTASAWANMLRVDRDSWQWAIAQWTAYWGPFLTPVLGMFVTAAWFTFAWRKRGGTSDASVPATLRRDFCRGMMHCLDRSAAVLAVVALLIYLALAPNVITQLESEYVKNLSVARPDGAYWTDLGQSRREVLADPEAMRRIQEAN